MRIAVPAVLFASLTMVPGCFAETSNDEDSGDSGADGGTTGDGDGTGDADGTESGADADGGTTEDSGDDGDTGAETTGAAEPPTCEEYCDAISVCEGDDAQYSTSGPCTSVCEHMDKGTKADQTGNTVGCRWLYALSAAEGTDDKSTFCRNAGPAGNGVCGGVCASFCRIQDTACTDTNGQFDSIADCTTACMGWDMTEPYSASSPEGNTFACRLKHLTYATLAPDVHCPHVGDVSSVCN